MFRLSLLAALLSFGACHHEPSPVLAPGEVIPLPPASGTPVGYLLDNAGLLSLTEAQMAELRRIDTSLSARNDGIDTQLREIETPEEEAPPDKRSAPLPPRNMAPGAVPTRTTVDAVKLHEARAANNKDALEKAFALLDEAQRAEAKKLLDARGVSSPSSSAANDAEGVPRTP